MNKNFGRIQEKTAALYQRTIESALKQVVTVLPPSAGPELQAFTLEKVLEVVFRDWNENGNTDELADADWKDLASFVEMSASLSGKQIATQGRPIYEASLLSLLDDWLQNWNADGNDGPPGPAERTRIQRGR